MRVGRERGFWRKPIGPLGAVVATIEMMRIATLSPVAILAVDGFGWRLLGPAQPWTLHNSREGKV